MQSAQRATDCCGIVGRDAGFAQALVQRLTTAIPAVQPLALLLLALLVAAGAWRTRPRR